MSSSDKLLGVLALFTVERPEWTVESASQEIGLTVSSAYRYFKSLAGAGLIVAYSSGRYILGPAFIQYDRQIRLIDPVITSARPVMERLASELPPQTVVLLCRLYRTQVMCVHQEFLQRPGFASSYERGRPMPLHRGAASKIILANMPTRTVKALHARQVDEMQAVGLGSTWSEVAQSLRLIRQAGMVVTEAELDIGMRGVAVPLFSDGGTILGSLCTVSPRPMAHEGQITDQEIASQLDRSARRIEAGMASAAASDRAAHST